MASDYLIQIVYKDTGQLVHSWHPGLEVEQELIDNICAAIEAKSVGIFRTKKQVKAAVKEALEQFLFDLKKLV